MTTFDVCDSVFTVVNKDADSPNVASNFALISVVDEPLIKNILSRPSLPFFFQTWRIVKLQNFIKSQNQNGTD